jgi:hypothetical protein
MGDIQTGFFGKIFPEIFYEYFVYGIEPPSDLTKCHIWGGYGRGDPPFKGEGGIIHPPGDRYRTQV